jgi:hypothetical protein
METAIRRAFRAVMGICIPALMLGCAARPRGALANGSAFAETEITPFPPSFHERMVPTNGTNLYVRVGGKGPAVVPLHGFGFTGDMWAPLAIVLAKDHTVIVPDLRGMGMSDHPDTGYTKKNQAVDIAGVMDTLEVQQADLITLPPLPATRT